MPCVALASLIESRDLALIHPINDIQDPRLGPYRELRDKNLQNEGLFVVEGRLLAQRMIESRLRPHSLLLTPDAQEEFQLLLTSQPHLDCPLFLAPRSLISQIIGFEFHRGVIACGHRPSPLALDALVEQLSLQETCTLLVLPNTNVVENLGSMARSAAAFGVSAMILGSQSCDPYYRRSIRVSMGAVFQMPLYRSSDLVQDLILLKQALKLESAATILSPNATPLRTFQRPARLALMMGNEAQGLNASLIQQADHHITLPMAAGHDSLNVAVSTAVFLHELCSS